jgi:Glycyl-tRNA synthetase (class II)
MCVVVKLLCSYFTDASIGEELSQLSLYLTKQLQNVGISTLLLPDVAKKSQESLFSRNDELGIPYTVVLNDATLKNGILALRSRDTTLKVSAGSITSSYYHHLGCDKVQLN